MGIFILNKSNYLVTMCSEINRTFNNLGNPQIYIFYLFVNMFSLFNSTIDYIPNSIINSSTESKLEKIEIKIAFSMAIMALIVGMVFYFDDREKIEKIQE